MHGPGLPGGSPHGTDAGAIFGVGVSSPSQGNGHLELGMLVPVVFGANQRYQEAVGFLWEEAKSKEIESKKSSNGNISVCAFCF